MFDFPKKDQTSEYSFYMTVNKYFKCNRKKIIQLNSDGNLKKYKIGKNSQEKHEICIKWKVFTSEILNLTSNPNLGN